jgi:hypothetical protein
MSSKPAASSANKAYLTAYNAVSCGLWATILYRTVTIVGKDGNWGVLFEQTGEFVTWAQTAAIMEIAHSVLGKLRVAFFWVLGGMGQA